jgi:hypothetical protein
MRRSVLSVCSLVVIVLGLSSCASSPPPEGAAIANAQGASSEAAGTNTKADPAGKKYGARWTVATEAEVAAALDKQLQDAAKGLVALKKDGVLMFCKRYREVGSNIRTLKCITVAELRTRAENMQNYREQMRNNSGKCTRGRSGGPPCGA